MTLECDLLSIDESKTSFHVKGKIVNALADESVLNDKGVIDINKVNPITFDISQFGYHTIGDKVGVAWNIGKELMKRIISRISKIKSHPTII